MPLDVPSLASIGWGSVAGATGGPTLPTVVTVTALGSTNLNTLHPPAGRNVSFQLWGAGAGGSGSKDSDNAGAGGGAGAYIGGLIPAALWAKGGSVFIGTAGAGGARTANGSPGTDTTLTLNAIIEAEAGHGLGGVAATQTGGAGGEPITGTHVTVTAARAGGAGESVVDDVSGAGGLSAVGGAGAGGHGAPNDEEGDPGENGKAVFSW